MDSKEFFDKLCRLSELKTKIENEVKQTYEEHNKLTAELTEEIIHRKAGDVIGIIKTSLSVKFRCGRGWVLRPNFIKGGILENVIWKPVGVHAFTVEEITPVNKE